MAGSEDLADEDDEEMEERVKTIAQAIAVAEGYYATGDHDGRSLLYRLNNPGGLKKPALDAEELPPWLDTGLVIFPSDTAQARAKIELAYSLSCRAPTGALKVTNPSRA